MAFRSVVSWLICAIQWENDAEILKQNGHTYKRSEALSGFLCPDGALCGGQLDQQPPHVRQWARGGDSSAKIKAIRIHDLDPGGHEVPHKLFLIIILCIDLGIGPQDRV